MLPLLKNCADSSRCKVSMVRLLYRAAADEHVPQDRSSTGTPLPVRPKNSSSRVSTEGDFLMSPATLLLVVVAAARLPSEEPLSSFRSLLVQYVRPATSDTMKQMM